VGQRTWAVRLGTAFALGVVLTALNPRGFAQHLTFFTSSQEAAIWYIRDEWLAFDPFRWGHYPPASVSFTAWIFTDALLAAFFAVALVIGARFWRRPTASDREALEPVRFGIGLAGVVALLVSIRFLWMGIFPMLVLLRALRLERARSPRVGVGFDRGLMAGTLLLVGLFSGVTGFRHDSAAPGFYLSRPYSVPDYYAAAVHFLHETGVEGKLFNEYGLGGYLGYWLSPKLRTFIDSRTEHYAPDVLYDCLAIYEQRGRLPKESIADVLERREVDLFIGTGLPLAHRVSKKAKRYTTSHLEHATGWLLVSRSANQAIYLRKNERNRDNLELISDYYERQGVPFDSAIGLDPGQVIAERPDWAIAHQMIPFEYELWLNESEDPDPEVRFRAIDRLAAVLGLVGAYETAADFELEALALWPGSEAVRRRLAYDLLRLDRFDEAREQGRLLVELHRDSQRAVLFAAAADRYSAMRLQGRDVWPPDDDHPPIDSIVNRLPLLDDAETAYYVHGRYARVADPQ
jgi:tetratricopeptide (TPR) repeat protein